MAKKYKAEKKSRTVIQTVGIGVLLSIVLTLIAAGVAASLIVKEQWEENMIGIAANVIVGISAFLGALTAVKSATDKYALISGATVIVYAFLLFSVGVLFFGSGFHKPWSNLLAIGVGGVLACSFALKKGSGTRRNKVHRR